MSPAEGSSADFPCPKCRLRKVVVALVTADAIYYQCRDCRHSVTVPQPTPAKAKRRSSRKKSA